MENLAMKILLMICFIFSVQNICFAADSSTQDGLDHFTVTHKYHYDERRGGIWYPNIYPNYESFQEENITNLLADRLKTLTELKKLHSKWILKEMPESEYGDLKFELECNEIGILCNCKSDLLASVFGENYDGDYIQTDHIENVAISLKNRLLGDAFNETRTKLDQIIGQIKSFNEKEGQFFVIGKKSFLYPKK